MSFWEAINPWTGRRRLRIELERVWGDLMDEKRQTWALKTALKDVERQLDERKQDLLLARLEHANLIVKAHFRDPKTGRIGKRGETFL